MKLRIYKSADIENPAVEYIDVEAFDVNVSRALNAKDEISFNIKSESSLDLPLGSTILVTVGLNTRYTLNQLPVYEKKSSILHCYSLVFQSPLFDLDKVAFRLDGEGEFFFNGRASDFIDLIIDNIERVGTGIPSTWVAGTSKVTEFKNMQFQDQTCWQALNAICDEFDLEFLNSVSGSDQTIALIEKIGNATSVNVSYGKGEGLFNIKRTNVDVDKLITRLYYRGSDRNLPVDYVPTRLEGTTDYIESNVSVYGLREGNYANDEIYPRFQGEVDSFEITMTDEAVPKPDKYLLVDAAFPVDLNEKMPDGETTKYLISGTSAKLNFLTGNCAGYTFDVASYDHDIFTFNLIPYKDEAGNSVPNSTVFPALGDKYVIIDIRMPEATYLAAAVAELDAAATLHLSNVSTPRVSYTLESDPNYFSTNNILLNIGDIITVDDTDLNISESCRVIELNYPLFDPAKVTFKLSDVRFAIPTRKTKTLLNRLNKVLSSTGIDKVEKVMRSAKTTNELKNKIFSVNDEFFIPENNKSASLDPYMIAPDTGEMQFSIKDIEITPNNNNDKTKIGVAAGTIYHHSFYGETRAAIEKKLLNNVDYTPHREWTVDATELTFEGDEKSCFIYAQLPLDESETTASIVVSEDHLWPLSTLGSVMYKLGFISKVVEGKRKANLLWGQSLGGDESNTKAGIISLNAGWNWVSIPRQKDINYNPVCNTYDAADNVVGNKVAYSTLEVSRFSIWVNKACTLRWEIFSRT